MNKKISFIELAKISGVGLGTLSRYFNDGPVSKKNKEIIKKNIEKYNFVRNAHAASIKKKNTNMVILRTIVRSNALDGIIAGIISTTKDKALVKYCGETEEEIITGINESISLALKTLVVFAPIDPTPRFDQAIKAATRSSRIIVYGYKTDATSCVTISYENAFKELVKKNKKINFIYNTKDDHNIYSLRIDELKNAGAVITVSKEPKQSGLNFYQTNFLYAKIAHNNNFESAVISYQEPIKFVDSVKWIFVDYHYAGVVINDLSEKENGSIIIDAKFINE